MIIYYLHGDLRGRCVLAFRAAKVLSSVDDPLYDGDDHDDCECDDAVVYLPVRSFDTAMGKG